MLMASGLDSKLQDLHLSAKVQGLYYGGRQPLHSLALKAFAGGRAVEIQDVKNKTRGPKCITYVKPHITKLRLDLAVFAPLEIES